MKYLQYFFYLGFNWNFPIAWHILRHEISGEKKYRLQTTGADELKHLEEKGIDIEHSTMYMPASYDVLEKVFATIGLDHCRHFIDIGCGKGRVLTVAAYHGAKKVTGIELSKKFCKEAVANLEKTKEQFPALQYNIINNDAFYYEVPDDAEVIFMFNPFDEMVMKAVWENIRQSLKRAPRKMTIIYLNPLYKHIFLKAGYKEIFHTQELNYLEASVLVK
ncbi:MAG: hypothetical protein JWQ27_2802 [Ferruginibacter sp.]|nr:hypothetical protein [Ferruginibacter sp.]